MNLKKNCKKYNKNAKSTLVFSTSVPCVYMGIYLFSFFLVIIKLCKKYFKAENMH